MKTLLTIVIALLPIIALAQNEVPDSIKTQELKEVVVEAQMQTTSSNVTTYYPDRNSKRTAQNALDLLEQMAIPQISVNPVGGTVQTHSGDEIALYIDMERATQEEKDGLRAEDVKKVEYFIFPTDPRFNHEKYVINIALRHYDYGGYAKLSGTDNIMAGSGSGLAYSKVAYKRMTYDISVNDKYTDRGHTGTEQRQIYRFPQQDGSISEITRDNLLDDSRYEQNRFGASFRARSISEKMVLSNSLFLTAVNAPHSDYSGRLVFTPSVFNGETYSNSLNSSYIYPRWSGAYYFDMGNGYKLNAMPQLFYQHTKSNRTYHTDETNIVTDATEDAITGQLQLQLNKTFNKYHTIDINLLGVYYHDRVKYTGSTVSSPVFNQFAYGVVLGYSFSKGNFYGQAAGGLAGESNKISGTRTNSIIPIAQVNAQYAFNRKNSISLSAQYNVNPVEASDKTPDIIQENELLYKTGNLHLKNTHWSKVTLDYTWLQSNKFSISGFAGWSRYFNRPMPIFTPDGPNGLMLRSLENNGDYQDFYIGGSVSAKLFDRNLVLQASPKMWFEKTTGVYSDKANYLSLSASVTYYLGNCYFQAYYSSASRGLVQYSLNAISLKRKPYYSFKIGWRNGKWNLTATAVNIFRKNWVAETSSLQSKWFDQYTTDYSATSHQFVSLTASYTFGFGKKVKHGDEVQNQENGSSAIMK